MVVAKFLRCWWDCVSIVFLFCLFFFFTAALNRYSMSRVSSDRPFFEMVIAGMDTPKYGETLRDT